MALKNCLNKTLWCEQLLQRKNKCKSKDTDTDTDTDEDEDKDQVDTEDQDRYQYSVYVLEANLSFRNGMVIPLLSEFLDYEHGDRENNKQDCEQRAFKRLAERLKSYFPRLPILLLLDGLYANGPIMEQCHKNHWQFMIVLKDESLPTVWEEFDSLLKVRPNHNADQTWGTRRQRFKWVNQIEYYYGANQGNLLTIHVVTCEEQWQAVDEKAEIVTRHSRHAWISSRPLNRNNCHERCNLGARYRWGIEACILVEKHQGYSYEHCFAWDWNAMKGYHYLMRLAHVFNTLARFSCALAKSFQAMGVRGFVAFVYHTLTGPWLLPDEVNARLNRPFQLRLE